MSKIKTEQAIKIQTVSEANGAWKWARGGRGRIRVAVVDTTKHHRQRNHKGYVETLYESGSLALGYAGGKWGFGDALAKAMDVAKSYSNQTGLPVIRA